MAVITKEAEELMSEIRKDDKAFQKLKNKAQWEHMTHFAILREWGDPRKWK